jgi:hypothetical protein
MQKSIALTCLLVIAQGFALFASAGDKNQIVDATHTLIVDREWKLSDEYPKENTEIPASQYVVDKSGKTYPMRFSQDQQSVTLFLPIEKPAAKGKKKHVALTGDLASSKDGVKTYVFAENAGGHLIVKPHGKGFEAEFTQYGSAVWLVSSARGRLQQRIKPQQ